MTNAIIDFYVDRVNRGKQTLDSIKEPYRSAVAEALAPSKAEIQPIVEDSQGNPLHPELVQDISYQPQQDPSAYNVTTNIDPVAEQAAQDATWIPQDTVYTDNTSGNPLF